MKGKHFLFCFSVILIVFFFRKIPLELIFQFEPSHPFAEKTRKLLLNAIVIAGCYLFASNNGLLLPGGFKSPVKRNYWMLLLPFLFPGLLMVAGSGIGCPGSVGVIAFTVSYALSGAMMEEVLFRGLLLGYLRKYTSGISDHFIILVTSTLFALVHFTNLENLHLLSVFPQVIYAFYMGLFFSALLYRTNHVWLLGLVHGILNYIATKCNDNSVQDVVNSTAVFHFRDYLVQVLGMILLFSPIMVIYWVLMKTRPGTL